MDTADDLEVMEPDDAPDVDDDEDDSGKAKAWYLQDAADVVGELDTREDDYFNACTSSGLVRMWRVAWAQYFGTDPDSPGEMATQVTKRVGQEREFTRLRVNFVRSFIKQAIQTAVGARPAYKATAESGDFETLAGIEAADRAVAYVMKTAFPETSRRRLIERALVLGAAFAHVRWDAEGGDDTTVPVPLTQPDGQPILDREGKPATEPFPEKTGSPVINIGAPWQWFYDPEDEDGLSWVVVRERRSKWELAALFPEFEDDLSNLGGQDKYSREALFGGNVLTQMTCNDDTLTLRHFYLPRSAGAPNGRYIGYTDDGIVLWDRELPLQVKGSMPVVPVVPSTYIGAFLGYADHWDVISIQQMIDNVVSDWASNVRAFGRAGLLNPKGSNLNLEAAAMGLRVLDFTPGADKPSYLEPPKLDNAESLLGWLQRAMEGVTQQNAVRRGDPQANIKSGTMAALFNQIAIEFMSDVQESFDGAQTQIANMVLELCAHRAKGEFMIEVAGKGARPYWEAFKASGMKSIRSITIESVSPMMRSPAGRFEAFQAISQIPPPDRGAVLHGLDTGDWSKYAEVDQTTEMLVEAENELILEGKQPQCGAADMHHLHVAKHMAVYNRLAASEVTTVPAPLMDPETGEEVPLPITPGRYNQQKQACLQHVLQHLNQWQMMDPRLASLLNVPPPPPMPGTPTGDLAMMTGGAPAPAGPGAPPDAGGGPPPDMPPDGADGAEGMPNQPQPAVPAQAPQGDMDAA